MKHPAAQADRREFACKEREGSGLLESAVLVGVEDAHCWWMRHLWQVLLLLLVQCCCLHVQHQQQLALPSLPVLLQTEGIAPRCHSRRQCQPNSQQCLCWKASAGSGWLASWLEMSPTGLLLRPKKQAHQTWQSPVWNAMALGKA